MWTILALCAILSANNLIIPVASQEKTAYQAVHSILVGSQQNDLVLAGGPAEFVAQPSDGKPCVRVSGQQTMIKIQSPLFITPETVLRWSWKKETGRVCILQATLKNTVTNQTRYFGYAAGDWSEPASADPTIEVLVSKELPQSWTPVERRLYDDMRQVLGWESAQITEIYLSPWDGEPGCFANVEIQHAATEDLEVMKQQQELAMLSKTGKGQYQPLPLKNYVDKRVDVFQTSFEECAPGRNSAANEWSAFGLDTGNKDFNAMGREMHVRYPAFDLVFQLYDGENEIKPDTLESFRLGLMENLYPAIWGGWQYDDLLYKVTAMTVPYKENGAADLFKIEVQNPTDQPRVSKLIAGMEGPPDMHLDAENIVRGLSDAPFLIADAPKESPLWLREYGLCDKRAKAYAVGDGPGKT
nr:hypothetical protein [Candidatus Hydrogenedentota bacterium]